MGFCVETGRHRWHSEPMVRGHKKLLGLRVVTQDGTTLGEVDGFDIDTESWAVVALAVHLDRHVLEPLKLAKPMFGTPTVKIGVSSVAGVGDSVVLKASLADLSFLDRGES